MNEVPRREHWNGDPVELGDAWTLRKGEKVARCILVTHPLGWELRLMTNDLLRSQLVVTTRNRPRAVLVSVERYEEMLRALEQGTGS